jgi:hypothetical protein
VTVWDGGVSLPASIDDVHANTFTVDIDQNITVNSLRTTSGSGITVGGSFRVASGSPVINVTAGLIGATHNGVNSTAILNITGGTPTVNANVTGGTSSGRHGVQITGGTSTITGTITGGTGAVSTYGVHIPSGTPTVTINGDVVGITASSSSNNFGVNIAANATVTVNGNLSTSAGPNASAAVSCTGTTAEVVINGDITGGSAQLTAVGFIGSGASAQYTITGNIYGAVGYGVSVTAGYLSLDGCSLYPSATGVPAVNSTGTCRFHGNAYFYTTTSTGQGYCPIAGRWQAWGGQELIFHMFETDGWPFTYSGDVLQITNYGSNLPAAEDVRVGVDYGGGSALTGTLAVPSPASVAAGIPTDDTVGTAAVSLADVLAGTGAQIAAATSG